MVIPRILYRYIYNVSLPNRTKPLENVSCDRMFRRKFENCFSVISTRNYRGYEGDGKTVGTVINKKTADVLCIHQFMSEGFILPNGSQLIGSLMIFPHAIMSWNVSEAKNVTEESLVLFKLLEPKIDILVFGYGNRRDYTPEVRENFTKCCKKLGLRFEALPTDQAVGTFNFLADEHRLVAGALIPPKYVDVLKFDRSRKLLLDDGEEEEEEEDLTAIGDGALKRKLLK